MLKVFYFGVIVRLQGFEARYNFTFTGELAVVFPTGLVVADHTDDVLPVLVLGASALVVGALLAHTVTGR